MVHESYYSVSCIKNLLSGMILQKSWVRQEHPEGDIFGRAVKAKLRPMWQFDT